MKRPERPYQRDHDGRNGTGQATLLRIADLARLGDHTASASLTAPQLDAMIDHIVSTTGVEKSDLAAQHPAYILTRYSHCRRADGESTTTGSAAREEKMARARMIAASRDASRSAPARRTDCTPAPMDARELERREAAAMKAESADAWRKRRK